MAVRSGRCAEVEALNLPDDGAVGHDGAEGDDADEDEGVSSDNRASKQTRKRQNRKSGIHNSNG